MSEVDLEQMQSASETTEVQEADISEQQLREQIKQQEFLNNGQEILAVEECMNFGQTIDFIKDMESRLSQIEGRFPREIVVSDTQSELMNNSDQVVTIGREALAHLDLSHEEAYHTIQENLSINHAIKSSSATQDNISFSGLSHIEPVADQQIGGTCWLEAMENMLQLQRNIFYGNEMARDIYKVVADNPEHFSAVQYMDDTNGLMYNINPEKYPELLQLGGVEAEWKAFSHEALQDALKHNKTVLSVGDPHYIRPESYPANRSNDSFHAFVITDYKAGYYEGIDSNFPGEVQQWTPEGLERSLQAYADATGNPSQFLESKHEAEWAHKTNTAAAIDVKKTIGANIENNSESRELPVDNWEQSFNDIVTNWSGISAAEKIRLLNHFNESIAAVLDVDIHELGFEPSVLENAAEPNSFLSDILGKYSQHGEVSPLAENQIPSSQSLSFGNSIISICERICIGKYSYEIMSYA